jgi:hypothetical protein
MKKKKMQNFFQQYCSQLHGNAFLANAAYFAEIDAFPNTFELESVESRHMLLAAFLKYF